MPITADLTVPHQVLDTKGNIISSDARKGADYKPPALDTANRPVATETAPEQSKPGEATPAAASPVEGQPDASTEATPKDPEAAARKLFLDAQKAERRAKEAEKAAKAGLAKAQAFEKAVELVKTGGDPTSILAAAGLDPTKFYQQLTDHWLKEPAKEEDATTKQLREHQERLDQYAKDLEVQATTIKQKEELAQHNQIITNQVIPLLQKEPDRYEALLTEYGPNAAVEVYKAVWERYQQTGEMVPFEQAADRMEEYWSQQIESGLIAASKLKKFANRFAQQANTQDTPKPDQATETPNRSFTLSNQHIAAPTQPQQKPAIQRGLTWDERKRAIIGKY